MYGNYLFSMVKVLMLVLSPHLFVLSTLFTTEMQHKGKTLNTPVGQNYLPKNGPTAMIAAMNSNGHVMESVPLNTQVEVGQRVAKEPFENGDYCPNLNTCNNALSMYSSFLLYHPVRVLQSSPNLVPNILKISVFVEVNYKVFKSATKS